ncbi:MAG: glycosyltransferase family 2 protein [Gemmatimonadaceae bacterium]
MLYLCIPAYNEAPTIGVLLWRIRRVFQEYPREYEIIVFDDGSTDSTADTLAPYGKVLPMTRIGGPGRIGYAGALDALCRTVNRRTRYARRDAMIVLQGDFTDQPEHIPELVKRFEGGADVVVAERMVEAISQKPPRLLRRMAPWVLKPFITIPGVSDAGNAFRLYRISVIRDLLKELGDRPVAQHGGWAANVELLVNATRHARRVESVTLSPRYDLRSRATRIRPFADAMNLYRSGRALRARRPAGTAP